MCAKYYELRYMFKKLHPVKFGSFAWCSVNSIFALFSVSDLKDEKLKKSKPTWKLKHANSILEYFEYFCKMSSKSIFIVLSYTVSKLVRFLRNSVHMYHAHTYVYMRSILDHRLLEQLHTSFTAIYMYHIHTYVWHIYISIMHMHMYDINTYEWHTYICTRELQDHRLLYKDNASTNEPNVILQ